MSIDTQPKSRSEWFVFVDEQATSGISQTEFCKQRNLILYHFNYYKKLRMRNRTSIPQESFSPVVIRPDKKPSTSEVKIDLPNGFCCHLPSSIPAEQLKQIISVLLSC